MKHYKLLLLITVLLYLTGCAQFKKSDNRTSYTYAKWGYQNSILAVRYQETAYSRNPHNREITAAQCDIISITTSNNQISTIIANIHPSGLQTHQPSAWLFYYTDTDIQIRSIENNPTQITLTPSTLNFTCDFSFNNAELATLEKTDETTYTLHKYSISGTTAVLDETLESITTNICQVVWQNPDALALIKTNAILICNPDGSTYNSVEADPTRLLRFSSDNQYLAFLTDTELKKVNIQTLEITSVLNYPKESFIIADITPDFKTLLISWTARDGWGIYTKEVADAHAPIIKLLP